mmetsp:Transcript_43228/g.136696  ORF Transcript_43228/g.136696 Transcript_43228/m.136696 type:complete len:345 (-) Transcript_43228:65-1099(-)
MKRVLVLLLLLTRCLHPSFSSSPLRPAAYPRADGALPPEWKSAKDRRGREYYYHVRTKKATWSFPERRTLVFSRFPIDPTIVPSFPVIRVRPAEEFVSQLQNKTKAVLVFYMPQVIRNPVFNNSFLLLRQTETLGYQEDEATAIEDITDCMAKTNSSTSTPYVTWKSPFTIREGSFYHFRSSTQGNPAVLSGRWWMLQETCGTFSGLNMLMRSDELYMHLFLILGGPWLFEKCTMRYSTATVVKCSLSSDVEARDCCIGGISERARCADVFQVRDSSQVSLQRCSLLLAGDIGRSIRSYGAGRAVVSHCHLEQGAFAATLDDYSSIRFEETCIQHFKVAVFHCM